MIIIFPIKLLTLSLTKLFIVKVKSTSDVLTKKLNLVKSEGSAMFIFPRVVIIN